MPRPEGKPRIVYHIKDGFLYFIGQDVSIIEIKKQMCMAFKLGPEAVDKMIATMQQLRKEM